MGGLTGKVAIVRCAGRWIRWLALQCWPLPAPQYLASSDGAAAPRVAEG